jgi:hypothetical protein
MEEARPPDLGSTRTITLRLSDRAAEPAIERLGELSGRDAPSGGYFVAGCAGPRRRRFSINAKRAAACLRWRYWDLAFWALTVGCPGRPPLAGRPRHPPYVYRLARSRPIRRSKRSSSGTRARMRWKS